MSMGAVWTTWSFVATLGMWTAMMAAMMLPSSVPMLRVVAASNRDVGQAKADATPVALVAAGYLAAWTGFSVVATIVQLALRSAMALSPALALVDRRVAGAALIAAGVYQLTPFKGACLSQCRSPFSLLLHHSTGGATGALGMGLVHGASCVGCCWLLMLVLFVVGVMNIPWVILLAVAVAVEKLAGAERWPRRVIGVSLLAWGGLTLARVL
jgi:predicted metal-binding membrane protein